MGREGGGMGGNARHCGDVVDVGLVDHCCHCFGYVSLAELVFCVFFPYGFEVKVRSS